jgi:5-methylcytosine-specific restriction endonuclease McrA
MSLKNSVLLLNASYEPIGLIGIQRAICLEYLDKIYVEEYNEENTYHSPTKEVRVPSVVRLKHYINIAKRRRETQKKRNRIYISDKFRCGYCGIKESPKELTLDHIIPKAKRNEVSWEIINSPENLVTCCFKCNQKKKDKYLSECGLNLMYPPKHFKTRLDKVLAGHYAEVRPTWAKYLYVEESSSGDSRYAHKE